MLISLFLAIAVPVVPSGKTFTCTATQVWDGDGPIWCEEGPRIRLHNIAARELDGSCRAGHPCPTASGIAARDHLVHLLGGAKGKSSYGHIRVSAVLRCRSHGSGKGKRTAASCSTRRGEDLAALMIRDGYALLWKQR